MIKFLFNFCDFKEINLNMSWRQKIIRLLFFFIIRVITNVLSYNLSHQIKSSTDIPIQSISLRIFFHFFCMLIYKIAATFQAILTYLKIHFIKLTPSHKLLATSVM